jgi:hypothetical protein
MNTDNVSMFLLVEKGCYVTVVETMVLKPMVFSKPALTLCGLVVEQRER